MIEYTTFYSVELDWVAELGIADMVADTWRWQSANPNGYPDS